jgi:uncharacterized protein (TIGR00661 family)
MRILFIVTGVGLGDSIRVNTVIDALKKENPNTNILIVGYANSYYYFKEKYSTINIAGYTIPGRSMKFRFLPFILRNFILPLYWLFIAFKLKKAVKMFKPDIVISDFEPTGVVLAKLVNKKCVMLFGFNPLLYKQFKAENKVGAIMALQAKYLEKNYDLGNFVIVPTLLGVKRKTLIYTFVNPITRTKLKDLPAERTLMKKLGFKKKPILVMLGGSNFGIKLLKKLKSIAHEYPDEIFIVFGTKNLVEPLPNLLHYIYKENVLEYMKIAKFVITLGGEVTLSEAVTFKKPMLIYPIKNHVEQMLNAYSLKNVAMVGKDVKTLRDDLNNFIKNLDSYQKKMSKLKVESNGAEQVVKIIKSLV